MVFSKALALAAIFATLSAAAPMKQKRALVYETVTHTDLTTIDTTITLYPGEATPTFSNVVAAATTTAAAVTTVSTEKIAESTSTSSTSTYVPPAPAPTTSTAAATTTAAAAPAVTSSTSTYIPPTTTSSTSTAAASTSSSSSSSSSSGSILSGTGDGTYYDTATSMSAPSYCDTANNGESENVVALSHAVMDESLCGATITVEYEGVTTTGTVVDKCMGCDAESIDMSRHMFGDLSPLSAGRITVSWSVN